jgi:hypothetical protein
MRKITVLLDIRRKGVGPVEPRKSSTQAEIFQMPNSPDRLERAEALLTEEDRSPIPGFALDEPPTRYLVIESDEFGMPLKAHQADSLREIAKLLESGNCEAEITEIHDLDTGEILRPYFERIYRVPRIYRGDMIAYQSPPDAR